jgi:hypothetical protein
MMTRSLADVEKQEAAQHVDVKAERTRFALDMAVNALLSAPLDWATQKALSAPAPPRGLLGAGTPLKPLKLSPFYYNEENIVNPHGTTVVYLKTPEERAAFRVTISPQGKLLDASGKPFDTALGDLSNRPGCGACGILVGEPMKPGDTTVNLFGSVIHPPGFIQHSTFFGRGDVIMPMEVGTDPDGTVRWISNEAGHHSPSAGHFFTGLDLLQKQGLDLSGAQILPH